MGTVERVDNDGDLLVDFDDLEDLEWVFASQIDKLEVLAPGVTPADGGGGAEQPHKGLAEWVERRRERILRKIAAVQDEIGAMEEAEEQLAREAEWRTLKEFTQRDVDETKLDLREREKSSRSTSAGTAAAAPPKPPRVTSASRGLSGGPFNYLPRRPTQSGALPTAGTFAIRRVSSGCFLSPAAGAAHRAALPRAAVGLLRRLVAG